MPYLMQLLKASFARTDVGSNWKIKTTTIAKKKKKMQGSIYLFSNWLKYVIGKVY